MKKLFDDTFWRMFSGFVIILAISILSLILVKENANKASNQNLIAHAQTH